MTDSLVIAVDGPAGSGKSSAARGAARELGLAYLDTGAMYRAVTWWLLEQGVPVDDPGAVARRATEPALEVGIDPDAPAIAVDGVDVSGPIRAREVSNAVSAVASVPQVRAHLIGMQREIIAAACAAGPGIVAEGRDIGAVVAPGAQVKVFLTASEAVRARRRAADLSADPTATASLTRSEINRRDRVDAPQSAKADDAVEIDSTRLSLDAVVEAVVDLARERGWEQAAGPAGAADGQPRPGGRMDAAWTI